MSYLQDEGILTNLQSFRRCLKAFYAKKKTQNTSKNTKERSCKQPAILSDLVTWRAFLQKARKLFGPENVPEKLPKTVFCVSQSTRKVRARKTSRQFTPTSYGSSHAPENVFGKLTDDTNGSCWSTFFEKVYSVK